VCVCVCVRASADAFVCTICAVLIQFCSFCYIYTDLPVPPRWTKQEATGDDITGRCARRDCGNKAICIPKRTPEGVNDGDCVSVPSDCGVPAPVSGGVFTHSGTTHGDRANLTCQPNHYLLPERSLGVATCDIFGRWGPAGLSCALVSQ
jgi:hypothetical protein